MAKKDKGTHNKITKYEMERAHRIKQNQEKINALGLKQLSTSRPKRARVERKRVSVQVNDDDYVPSIGEDDGDDESSRSSHNEMAPGRITRSRHDESTLAVQHTGPLSSLLPSGDFEMARSQREKSIPAVQHIGPSLSTHLGGDPLAQISTNVEAQLVGSPSSTGASTSRRARGTTCGLRVRGLVEKHGKLPVRIAPEYSAPVGKHASKLACQIGVQVRTNLSTMNVYRWKNVDSGQKEAIIQNVADQFDLQGDSALVNKTLNTKCGRLLSSHSNKLFAKYKKLVEKEGKTYAKNHPPPNVTREKWIELIDGKWSDKDWLEVSKRNAAIRNRMVSKHIHKCGSKSLAVRVDEERQKNGGHIPKLAKVYHDTHFDSQKNQWVHPDCENTYQEMLSVQDEHCNTSDTEPLTEEEISMIVLKPRSGYVKGLGMRPSSSLRTSASSSSTHYIQQLESQIDELKDVNSRQEEKIDELQDAKLRQEEKIDLQNTQIASIIQFLRSKGFNDICGSGGSSSTNY